MINFNGAAAIETPEFLNARIDKLGGPDSDNHYAVGWAHAMNTPYQWTKQVASHWGGTRNGTIVHWPKGIKGKRRAAFSVSPCDIALPRRFSRRVQAQGCAVINWVQQKLIEGATSMLYNFMDVQAGPAARYQILRNVRQSRHLPQGLDCGDAAQNPVALDRRKGPSLRR